MWGEGDEQVGPVTVSSSVTQILPFVLCSPETYSTAGQPWASSWRVWWT
jgi:hypothetical protein